MRGSGEAAEGTEVTDQHGGTEQRRRSESRSAGGPRRGPPTREAMKPRTSRGPSHARLVLGFVASRVPPSAAKPNGFVSFVDFVARTFSVAPLLRVKPVPSADSVTYTRIFRTQIALFSQ